MTIVPYQQLQPQTLQLLVEDFVTREGAVHGHDDVALSAKIAAVLNQLKSGVVVIVFDEISESCTIMTKQDLPLNGETGN
jgi:uncharacterized protein YheU (UPF0270 family)